MFRVISLIYFRKFPNNHEWFIRIWRSTLTDLLSRKYSVSNKWMVDPVRRPSGLASVIPHEQEATRLSWLGFGVYSWIFGSFDRSVWNCVWLHRLSSETCCTSVNFCEIFLRHSWNSILNKKCDIKIFSLVVYSHVKYEGHISADAAEYLHTIMILIYGVNQGVWVSQTPCLNKSVFISESASVSYLMLVKSLHCQLCIYNVNYSMGHFPSNLSNANTHDCNK